VLENVMLGLYCGRTDLWRDFVSNGRWADDRRRAEDALEFVGLIDLRNQLTKNVPIGLRHTAELARALVSKPKLLMLDEAWAGLNTAESVALMGTVRRIRDQGVTVLLVEHNMKIVMQICDEIVVLDAGRKIAQGTPQAVRADKRVIESYLGTSSAGKSGEARA
jgi:branched-chain amino acid transport system ATP-binding protein